MNMGSVSERGNNVFQALKHEINHDREIAKKTASKGFYVSETGRQWNDLSYILKCFGCSKTFTVSTDHCSKSIKDQLSGYLSNEQQNKIHTYSCSIYNSQNPANST